MKKILSLVVIALLVAGVSYADLGGSRIGDEFTTAKIVYNSATENVGHAHICTGPAKVWRITYTSQVAGAYVALYDSNTSGKFSSTRAMVDALSGPTAGGNSFVKTCVGAAAADTVYQVTYDPPLKFDNGILVGWVAGNLTAPNAEDASPITVEYSN